MKKVGARKLLDVMDIDQVKETKAKNDVKRLDQTRCFLVYPLGHLPWDPYTAVRVGEVARPGPANSWRRKKIFRVWQADCRMNNCKP